MRRTSQHSWLSMCLYVFLLKCVCICLLSSKYSNGNYALIALQAKVLSAVSVPDSRKIVVCCVKPRMKIDSLKRVCQTKIINNSSCQNGRKAEEGSVNWWSKPDRNFFKFNEPTFSIFELFLPKKCKWNFIFRSWFLSNTQTPTAWRAFSMSLLPISYFVIHLFSIPNRSFLCCPDEGTTIVSSF